ncbi:bifunctional adenosylcobinamide kinase/adenosylcobinamide-phosphate guanylyltransferase [Robertmurraya massiliosenegalensis]|uniref:bifunctional adenosylcobinamide kinase/adenosylcobinamide-phosphate guanylyltransferase n=1 Tax=Robertmurraya TaxID=2837507 RepID=UPI0039A56B3B
MIFITGGVRSGKSTFAEKLAKERTRELEGNLHYLATGVASDKEMEQRIKRHQQERQESEFPWTTWEQSTGIEAIATSFSKKDIVLLDCVTTLLNNELFSQDKWDPQILEKLLRGIDVVQANCAELILVSNEVLWEGISDENELVLKYSKVIGNLHQELVARSRIAYLVEAGIPIAMKEENV